MKIDFPLPKDGDYHQFCLSCHVEAVSRITIGTKTFYKCAHCHATLTRSIVIDNEIIWWIDNKTKEYWHESVGTILFTRRKEVLVFERSIYPFAYAIPAGHLDRGELPAEAARRELKEETDLEVESLHLFAEEDVMGDSCRRGADNHRWHLYTLPYDDKSKKLKLNDEGDKARWIPFDELKKRNDLVFPLRYFIDKYGKKLVE